MDAFQKQKVKLSFTRFGLTPSVSFGEIGLQTQVSACAIDVSVKDKPLGYVLLMVAKVSKRVNYNRPIGLAIIAAYDHAGRGFNGRGENRYILELLSNYRKT